MSQMSNSSLSSVPKVSLTLGEHDYRKLRAAFYDRVRRSAALDPEFEVVAFEAFLRATLLAEASTAAHASRLEFNMDTPPVYRPEILWQRIMDVTRNMTAQSTFEGRRTLGHLEILLELAIDNGTIQPDSASSWLADVHRMRPDLHQERPYDIFDRAAAWLRWLLTAVKPSKY
jgi:hypothetical protein